jgi:hypothetical protein
MDIRVGFDGAYFINVGISIPAPSLTWYIESACATTPLPVTAATEPRINDNPIKMKMRSPCCIFIFMLLVGLHK